MATTAPSRILPTLHNLGGTIDPNLDAQAIVHDWFAKFVKVIGLKDVPAIVDLFIDGVFWRDMLALTWDFRTFEGKNAVSKFLEDQLSVFNPQPDTFSLQQDSIGLQKPYQDLAWIQAFFKFDTNVGHASGIFRLVPLPGGVWKAHVVYTNLEDLKGFPERTGPLRDFQPNHGKWAAKREREREFVDEEPTVVIVGGGQSGLEVAARLKMLGIGVLIVERNKRIGDNWRDRYSALCLHDPVCESDILIPLYTVLLFHCKGTTICPIYRKWIPLTKEMPRHAIDRLQVSTFVACLQSGTETGRLARVLCSFDGIERMDLGDRCLDRKGNRRQWEALVCSSRTRGWTKASFQGRPRRAGTWHRQRPFKVPKHSRTGKH